MQIWKPKSSLFLLRIASSVLGISTSRPYWFNCRAKDFEVRDGKTVTHLNFKVTTPEFAEEDNKKTEYIRHILREHFHFGDNEFLALRPILSSDEITRQQIINKIMQIVEYLSIHHDIVHKKEYALKSLMNEFID
jgi:hypothetical protein